MLMSSITVGSALKSLYILVNNKYIFVSCGPLKTAAVILKDACTRVNDV